ncbi:MAG: biotin-dependent carboxyltransferase family protein [Flavobacteriia bacterium]|nr:biotin-dependent carboxyltransferase family protein [Flavobacteriia bacterium]
MIKVLETGLYTSIQDLGRPDWHSLGIPYSGAMDAQSAQTANALLQNSPSAAVMEISMTGPILLFTKPCWVVFSGAQMPIYLGQQELSQHQPHWIKEAQEIRFGKLTKGFRLYMAIKGGFKTASVLGSRSMCKNVTPHFMVQKGMELDHETGTKDQGVYLKVQATTPLQAHEIKVYKGPEYGNLSKEQQENLENQEFQVSNLNNRMAYQLTPNIAPHQLNQITTPVLPGTVQLTPQGTLMVLMRDGQTTGGYPRVLQLSAKSVNAMAQLKTGDSFHFKLVALA